MSERLLAKGFAVQVEVNYRCFRSGLHVVEVPTVFTDRARGRSKMTMGIALEALLTVARLRLAPPSSHRVVRSWRM
jgi:dolichol-phosphate mannosyltransferase